MIAHGFLLLLLAVTTVRTPDGTLITTEIAATGEERANGLMKRTSLARNAGMLFVFPSDSPNQFWMKDTLIPLDMIWMDRDRRVVYIQRNAPPCPVIALQCPSYGPPSLTRYVLEVGAGGADRFGIREGTTLSFELPVNLKITN
jgi:uncharacterized membrane protein (UPF0127 family)